MKPAFLPLLLLTAILNGCGGHTLYKLHVDALTFIPEHQLSVVSPVPDGVGLTVYILPGVYADLTGSGPDQRQKRGMKITAPLPSHPPDEVRLKLEAQSLITVENLDATFTLPSTTVDVFLAGEDSTDVYTEGEIAFTVSESDLDPGSSVVLMIGDAITAGDPDYDLIEAGVFRMGFRLRIEPVPGQTVDVRYTIGALDIYVSGYPFGLIP